MAEVLTGDDLMTDEESAQMAAAAERLENGDSPPAGLYGGGDGETDVSPCMGCGEPAECIPDGLPVCDDCGDDFAGKLAEAETEPAEKTPSASAVKLAAIRAAEAEVDSAESDWLDCKEETKAAKSIMDAAIARLRSVIRGSDQPELPFEGDDEEKPAEDGELMVTEAVDNPDNVDGPCAADEAVDEAGGDDDEMPLAVTAEEWAESQSAGKPLHDEGAEFKLEWLETAHLRKLTGEKKILGMTMRLMSAVSQLCGGQMIGTLEQWIAETDEWETVLASRRGFSDTWVERLKWSLEQFRLIHPKPTDGDAPTVFDVG